MVNLHDIRYLRIGTPDLESAVEFATKIVGLQLVGREGKAAYFRSDKVSARGDTRDHTLVYFEGDPSDHVIAFDLKNRDDFDKAGAEIEKAGHPVHYGAKNECELRRVQQFLAFKDPTGNKIEIVVRPFHSGLRYFPSRDAGITHFSHIGLRTSDAPRDEAFWTRLLNARVSDWIGDAPLLRVNTIHHTLALFPSPHPGVQHINHQVEDFDDVMRSYYFLRDQGVKIVFGPGRHPSSSACFLYFEGPDKMVYEYSVGVKQALALASCASAPPKPVSVIVFPGGFNWPIWVAQEKGLFAKNGIEVKLTPTPSSVFQLTNLIDGKFDIAMTAIDNLIAYREGQGEVPKPGPDLFAFMGGDNGFLRLVTVPEVKSFGDLRGKTLSVDALTTGYAFVLLEILERNGLLKDRDYATAAAGGVLQRFQALMEKKHAGTLLLSPFEVQAEARGFNRLANATDVLGRYQGLVGGARKAWAEQNREAVIGYIRAFSDAVDWLYDSRNREEAIAIFLKNLPSANAQAAQTAYGVLLSPTDGFQMKAKMDMEGVKAVLALRSKYGKPEKGLTDPEKYYDPSFYEAAMRR